MKSGLKENGFQDDDGGSGGTELRAEEELNEQKAGCLIYVYERACAPRFWRSNAPAPRTAHATTVA